MSKRGSRLNDRQRKFVAAYVVSLNATKAAIEAGYSAKTARKIGSKLLTNADIAEAVSKRQEQHLAKAGLTHERVLKELARIAFADPRQVFDEQGNLRPLNELSDDMAGALAGVEVIVRRKPGQEKQVEEVHKVKFWDKNSALEKAMRHLGLLKDTTPPQLVTFTLNLDWPSQRAIDVTPTNGNGNGSH